MVDSSRKRAHGAIHTGRNDWQCKLRCPAQVSRTLPLPTASTISRRTPQATDPDTISWLWCRVESNNRRGRTRPAMSFQQDTVASRGHRQRPRVEAQGRQTRPAHTTRAGQQQQQEKRQGSRRRTPIPTPSTTSTNLTGDDSASIVPSEVASSVPRACKIRVTDKEFGRTICPNYNLINFPSDQLELRPPHECFGVSAPPEGASQEEIGTWYHHEIGGGDPSMWLSLAEPDAEGVSRVYLLLNEVGANEARFSYTAKEYFFRQGIALHPDAQGKHRSTYCTMEWAPRPSEAENRLYVPLSYSPRPRRLRPTIADLRVRQPTRPDLLGISLRSEENLSAPGRRGHLCSPWHRSGGAVSDRRV